MNISTLIKRKEIVIDKYGVLQKGPSPNHSTKVLSKLVKGISPYYLTYVLETYIKTLKVCNKPMLLKVTLINDILECYYLF